MLLVVAAIAAGCGGVQAQSGQIGGCSLFPSDNIWNTPVDTLPVDSHSAAYVASIGAATAFHPDFGSDPSYGIPYAVVPATQATVPVAFDYDDQSDPGPYPLSADVPIEAGSDHHILIVQQTSCTLYE